jgi:pimeloyl-ACP methyl ester carboxylesterase
VTRRLLILLPAIAALALVIALVVFRAGAPSRKLQRFAMGRGPTVAVLHGAGSGIQHWLPAARLLADGHRVVFIELPGHGLSLLDGPVSLESAAEALHVALAADSKEPVVLVGHGVGGMVAALEALQHPEKVRALVLVETALKPRLEGDARLRALEALELDFPRALRDMYAGYGRDSAQGAELHAHAAKIGLSTLKPWLQLELFADISLRMRHLKPPLLAIVGQRSWPAGWSWEAVAEPLGYAGAPRVSAARIEGTGHFPMLDHPEEIARLIRHFAGDSSRGPVATR